jgi:hypothetical protein
MFEFTNWEIEEPGVEETSKYDSLIPTVVHPSQQSEVSRKIIYPYPLTN